MTVDPPRTRRTVLRATSVALASVSVAGCSGVLDLTDGTPTGTVTPVPQPEHRVRVGPQGFEPRTVYVRPGGTVVWEWGSDGHNVVVTENPPGSAWDGHETVEARGFRHSHTFEVEGTYWYACEPHLEGPGFADARVVVTDDPPDATESDVLDVRGTSEVTVAVGPGGELVFDPARVRISPGPTVRFVWDSDNHSIVVGEQPAAAWDGHETVEDAGFSDAHTFTVPGRYEYWCRPHRTAGMEGTIFVGADE